MGVWELLVIAIVGLLVIGPEKLPETIKTTMVWVGRVKRMVTETRSELEQQLGVDDIRREIHNSEVMASLEALKDAKMDAEAEVSKANDRVNTLSEKIKEAEEPEDEQAFGDQRGQHPMTEEEEYESYFAPDAKDYDYTEESESVSENHDGDDDRGIDDSSENQDKKYTP